MAVMTAQDIIGPIIIIARITGLTIVHIIVAITTGSLRLPPTPR
jgi:hypothetical protein